MAMSLWACETVPTGQSVDDVSETRAKKELSNKDNVLAMQHYIDAVSAHEHGDHTICAASFALSAGVSESSDVSNARWVEAARCAARAGEFHDSEAYLQAAASQGYAELEVLMTEPLFRPLYDGGHWNMIIDQVAAHSRTKPQVQVADQELAKETLVAAREYLSSFCDDE